jgi:hypothetical protein
VAPVRYFSSSVAASFETSLSRLLRTRPQAY